MVHKLVPPAAAPLALFLTQALPAAACGGLIAPNGAIRLDRATTLVAWHDGVERYMTSFSYNGEASTFGWIVPLPAVPEKVEEGGGWTLQRLFRETHPQPAIAQLAFAVRAASADSAVVLQQVQVKALDITVLRGSGQAVLDWASQNGFAVDAETRAHVIQYAKGSPVFMAAKDNADRAAEQRLIFGGGAPVLVTMKIPHPWIPFEVPGGGQKGAARSLSPAEQAGQHQRVARTDRRLRRRHQCAGRGRLQPRVPGKDDGQSLQGPVDRQEHGLGPPRQLADLPDAQCTRQQGDLRHERDADGHCESRAVWHQADG